MFDFEELLFVELSDVEGDSVWIELAPRLLSPGHPGLEG